MITYILKLSGRQAGRLIWGESASYVVGLKGQFPHTDGGLARAAPPPATKERHIMASLSAFPNGKQIGIRKT